MQQWGLSTTILGGIAFGILAILGVLVMEHSTPERAVSDAENWDTERLRRELERERMALDALRLRAQIQSDLATIEASLAAAAQAPPLPAPESAPAEEFFEGEQDQDPMANVELIVQKEVGLVAAQLAALGSFEPDPVAYEEFSEPLESYGDWYETENYGPVWQPESTYVDNSWAPYTNGSWWYSNYGWNWESRDPFGWACDHYGRWVYISRYGWVWVPGRRWAPAWVSWRSCNTHIGWAPLPPCATWNRGIGIGGWVDGRCNIGPGHYNFVRRSHFGSRDCRASIVDRSHNAKLVGRSKNITRLEYGKHGVNNHGPGYNEVRSGSSEPIRRRTIDVADESRRKREKVEQGRTARAGRGDRPGIEKLPDARRETGWETGGDQGEVLRLRRQLVSEARGALLEQSSPMSKARGGATLTAITKPIRSRGGSEPVSRFSVAQPKDAEIVRVGGRPPSMKPAASGRGADDRSPGLPDHFAAERAQREATLAGQQAVMAERNRLASVRQSAEREAKQRIEAQIRGRRQPTTTTAREVQERQNVLAALATRSDATSSSSRANPRDQAPAPRSVLATNSRSRSVATNSRSTPAGRSIQKQASASAGSRSITRPQADPRRTPTSAPSPTSARRSVTRANMSPERRTGSVTRSRPTLSSSRQQKSTRPAVSTARSVPQTRSRTSKQTQPRSQPRPRAQPQPRSQPQSQPQRSSPQTARSSPQPQSQSKQSKPGSSSGRSVGSGRSRK